MEPKGVWFEESIDGFRLGLSTRSNAAWILVPFMVIWSGITLGATYGSQIASGEFSLGLTLFGVGPIGLRRRFDWSQVNTVHEPRGLVLEGGVRLDLFGSPTPEQRTFLLHSLRRRVIGGSRPEWS